MATKLKKLTRKTSVKVIAFLLAVIFSAGIVGFAELIAFTVEDSNMDLDIIGNKDSWYANVLDNARDIGDNTHSLVNEYSDENAIRNGELIKEQELLYRVLDAYESGDEYYDTDGLEPLTDKQIDNMEEDLKSAIRAYWGLGSSGSSEGVSDVKKWLKRNRTCYAAIRQDMINDQLAHASNLRNNLTEDYENYMVYSKAGENEGVGNATLADIRKCPAYVIFTPSEGRYQAVYNQSNDVYKQITDNFNSNQEVISLDQNENDTVAVGISQRFMNASEATAESVYTNLVGMVCGLISSCILLLLSLIALCAGAGNSEKNEKAELSVFDKIWTEVQIIWAVTIISLCAAGAGELIMYSVEDNYAWNLSDWVPILLGALSAVLCLPCLMSQVRRIKTGNFANGFITVRAVKWLAEKWNCGPIYIKVISLVIIVPILCMFPPFAFLIIIAGLYFGVKYIADFTAISEGAKNIRAGASGINIEVKQKKGELRQLADDMNGINDGLQNAVQTRLKSERLKTELISNVSHDLKTPLTGIVTYVDLMKKCDPTDEKMTEYLNVVDQKTQRLSTLINDILEASKASSGAIKTDMQRVDLNALFTQTCGELQDKIEDAGLEIRLKTQGNTDVLADGRLLWRVMDNLMNNCVRYAAEGSRVYAEIAEQGNWCIFTLKNISAQELNISADELVERFTRGDRARYTEGSGLGLSIAKSLTELMGGRFEITVDGDLFKAEVYMPIYKD